MKAAIYCRLSEEDRDKRTGKDSSSIQNQKALLLEYAAAHDWEVYQIYSDEDYAGADRSRPAFQKLLQDAEKRKFDVVLCKTQSRFTRELELVEKYLHGLFPQWGIRFVSVVDHADTDNRGNKKARQINGLINEWYLEDLSENIKSVLNHRRANGLHIGSFALYGYRKDPEHRGHLLVDEPAAQMVREVFNAFAQGHGKSEIARMLNVRSVPNPSAYKRLQGLACRQAGSRTGALWTYKSIDSMLRNRMYRGDMVQGKYGSVSYKTKQNKPRPPESWYIVPGTHPAIIEPELWEQVQKLRQQRMKPVTRGTVGLFTGKVRCQACGGALCVTKTRGVSYLRCANRRVSRDRCGGAFIAVPRLERMILEEWNRLTAQYLDAKQMENGLYHLLKFDTPDTLERLQKQEQDDAAVLERLYQDYARNVLTREKFQILACKIERKQAENAQKIRDFRQKNGKKSDKKRWEHYVRPTALTRDLVCAWIDFVCVGKRIPGTRQVPIEIHWNF